MTASSELWCRVAQLWLQEAAWTEAEKPARLATRMERARSREEQQHIAQQPMFCVETALKLHRWSQLAYSDYGQGTTGSRRSTGDQSEPSTPAVQALDLVKGRTHASALTDPSLADGESCHRFIQEGSFAWLTLDRLAHERAQNRCMRACRCRYRGTGSLKCQAWLCVLM